MAPVLGFQPEASIDLRFMALGSDLTVIQSMFGFSSAVKEG